MGLWRFQSPAYVKCNSRRLEGFAVDIMGGERESRGEV